MLWTPPPLLSSSPLPDKLLVAIIVAGVASAALAGGLEDGVTMRGGGDSDGFVCVGVRDSCGLNVLIPSAI